MKYFLKFLFLLLVPGCYGLYAQKQGRAAIDSLMNELSKAKEDTNKVKILYGISFNYYLIDPDKGIYYGNQSLALAEKLEWGKGIAWANTRLGNNNYAKSNYPLALEYYNKGLKMFEKLDDDHGLAAACGNIGLIYERQSNYPKALEYDLQALRICEKIGDKNRIAINYGNIGTIYWDENDYKKSLEYDLKSFQAFSELNNKAGMAGELGNMGNVYEDEGDHEKALEFYFKSLKINEELGNKKRIATNSGNIGGAYLAQKNYDSALKYFFYALSINKSLGDESGTAICFGGIGHTYLSIAKDTSGHIGSGKSTNIRLALTYLDSAKAIEQKIGNLNDWLGMVHNYSDAQEVSGNYKDALQNYKFYTLLKDSVFSAANKVKITGLETEREIMLKDKEIQIDKLEVAKKHNEGIFYLVCILLLLIVIGIILRNFFIQKRSNALLSKEKKRSEDLLLNILPVEVADELKDKGSSSARYYDHVTVMFTDFVNFTQAGERMNPQELIDELHTCFMAFDDIIGKYNIEKIKTIGDAYLAVSGLPVADTKHAENMVKAAVEINTYMHNRREKLGDNTFEIRIGIHSGSVVAGIVGVKKFAYDIWGDTVNTAARMEQSSEAGKINISETTYNLVKDKFNCVYRGEIEAKNKGQLKMYFVSM